MDRFERFSYAISVISRCWHRLAAEEMAKYDLKSSHATYLTTLSRYPDGLTAAQLCEVCGKDKSDVSRMMAILTKTGFVKKNGRNDAGNLYGGTYVLTDTGLDAAEKVKRRAAQVVEIAGKDLSDESRSMLYEMLAQISDNLVQLCKDGIPE
ncbi:MAG: winged helix-turn-helix transcriptional regulator [Clostridia bacterium]|nr:winged helix-turn-helix transcriptional regulator [Clostridia bacterium]